MNNNKLLEVAVTGIAIILAIAALVYFGKFVVALLSS